MSLINILDLKPNKVSTDIKDYSLMLTAPSGFGKTPFINELFGDKAFFLSFDNSHKGIAGIMAVNIDEYSTLKFYVQQLCNPEVRKKYDVVVIDTLTMFDMICEKSVTDTYGKETISDCLSYNKGYTVVDKRFLNIIKKLQKMNYSIVYLCHPTTKKIKLPSGQEISKIEPKVSKRIENLLMPEIDIRLYADYDENGNKVIYSNSSIYFDARCRVGDMKSPIPFTVTDLKREFAEGIERKYEKDCLTEKLEYKNIARDTERKLEDIMNELLTLGNDLTELGYGEKAKILLNNGLGLDDFGNQRTLDVVNETMKPTLEAIIIDLKALMEEVKKDR